MTEDVQMTFSVEQDLLDAFTAAATQQKRTPEQVLRDFMQAYVTLSRERQRAVADSAISETERRRRQEAVNFARASLGLSGFEPNADDEALAVRFVAGEISMEDAIRAVHAAARER